MASDLISRKALLERLEKIYGTNSIVDKIMLRFLKKLIRKQPTVDRWIPCSERMPEEDGIYLLQTESGMMFSGDFCRDMGNFGCWGESYDSCTNALLDRYWVGYGDIVAWMERPSPYKAGDIDG